MSYPAINWAFSAKLNRSCDKFLLVALASRADDQFVCYPSQARLVADTALDRKTVISGMARLIDSGLILDTGIRKGVTGQIVVYRLLGVAGPVAHYTYRTSDPKTGQFYLGKRSFDGDPDADPYRGSGKWVLKCKASGVLLLKDVVQRFDESWEALAHEQVLFQEHQKDPLCMNEGTPWKNGMAQRATAQHYRDAANKSKNGTVITVPNIPDNGPVFPAEGSHISPKGSQIRDTEYSEYPEELERKNLSHENDLLSNVPLSASLVQRAITIWNEVCGEACGKVLKATTARGQRLRVLLREEFANDGQKWETFCQRVNRSPFLSGKNDRAWVADFDWVLKPANFVKIIEGRYDVRNGVAASHPITGTF